MVLYPNSRSSLLLHLQNQEAAASVLAELTHLVAWGNAVAASQKLVWAVQRLARLPQESATDGALAALRLITEVCVYNVCL